MLIRYLPRSEVRPSVHPSSDPHAETRQSSREGHQLDYAPAEVAGAGEWSGWTFLLIGGVSWLLCSIILTPVAPLIGNAAAAACAIIAAIRFVRQQRRRRRSAGR